MQNFVLGVQHWKFKWFMEWFNDFMNDMNENRYISLKYWEDVYMSGQECFPRNAAGISHLFIQEVLYTLLLAEYVICFSGEFTSCDYVIIEDFFSSLRWPS